MEREMRPKRKKGELEQYGPLQRQTKLLSEGRYLRQQRAASTKRPRPQSDRHGGQSLPSRAAGRSDEHHVSTDVSVPVSNETELVVSGGTKQENLPSRQNRCRCNRFDSLSLLCRG